MIQETAPLAGRTDARQETADGIHPDFGWNITKSAEQLASLSAILAAFAFGALVIMLTTPPKPSNDAAVATSLELMVGSFFSLIVASFLFGVLTGSGGAYRRYKPFLEGLCASWILSLSTVELCACTAWLLSAYRVPIGVLPIGNGIVLGAVGITSLSLTGVAIAPLFQRPHGRGLTIGWLSISVVPIILSIPVGIWSPAWPQLASIPVTVEASVALTLVMALTYGIVDCLTEARIGALYKSKFGFFLFLPFIVALGGLYASYIHLLPAGS